MERRSFLCGLAACGGAALFPSRASADRPWSHYLELREQAPEVLSVIVRSLASATRDEEVAVGQYRYRQKVTDVTAQLQIEAVDRSATGLRPGQAIGLRYQIVVKDAGLPDVWPPRLLKDNEKVKVYLKREGRSYGLAAMKASFES